MASVHTAKPRASLPKASALDSFIISFLLLENKKGRDRKVQIKRINSWAAAVIAEGRELEGLLHQVSPLRRSTLLFWRFRSTGIPHQEGKSLTELKLHIPFLLHGGDITQGSYQPTHTINVKYSFLKNFKSRRRPSVWTFKRPPLYLETFWHTTNSLGKYRTHFELVPFFLKKKKKNPFKFAPFTFIASVRGGGSQDNY